MIGGKLYLVACASQKQESPAPAADLYVSDWFNKARAYVEGQIDREGGQWRILSAKHGLTDPQAVIAPYNLSVSADMTEAQRRVWAQKVLRQLDESGLQPDEIVILAGKHYRKHIIEPLEARGFKVTVPMRGLGIGQQKRWLPEHTPGVKVGPRAPRGRRWRKGTPVGDLVALAAEAGLEDAAGWLRKRAQLVDGTLSPPPQPSRGNSYSRTDIDKASEWILLLPRWQETQKRAKAMDRWAFEAPDPRAQTLDSVDPSARRYPRDVFQREAENLLRYVLPGEWRARKEPDRDPAWLADFLRREGDQFLAAMNEYMDVVEDESWFNGERTLADTLASLTEYGNPDASRYLDKLGTWIARVVHGFRFGQGAVPSFAEAVNGNVPITEILQAHERNRAERERKLEGKRREIMSGWSYLADVFDNLGDDATPREVNEHFKRRRGPGFKPTIEDTTHTLGGVQRSRWSVRHLVPGVTISAPQVEGNSDAGYRALRDYARAVRELGETTAAQPLDEWKATMARLGDMVKRPERDNPADLAPSLPPGLVDLARRMGLLEAAVWMDAHGPDLGAQLLQQGTWSALWPTGWKTQVWDASEAPLTSHKGQVVTRVDYGRLDPRDLLGVRNYADIPPRLWPAEFEHWQDRKERRKRGSPATYEKTTGGYAPANWRMFVSRTMADGHPPAEFPIIIERTPDEDLLMLPQGDVAVRLAIEAGLETVPVRVRYVGGSERHGLMVDPATGRWQPYPPGRPIKVIKDSGRGFKSATSAGMRGGKLSFSDEKMVETLGGWSQMERLVYPRNARFDMTVLRDWPEGGHLTLYRNPGRGRRVYVEIDGGEIRIRKLHGARRLMGRASSALLRGARVERDERGQVVGVTGQLVEQDKLSPPTLAGWLVLSEAEGGGRLLADRATIDGDDAIVFATVRRSGSSEEANARHDTSARVNRGSPTSVIYDSEGRKYPARYAVIEASLDGDGLLVVSHNPQDLSEWTPGYPRSFQTRDLGAPAEAAKIHQIAKDLDPMRVLGPNLDPTIGPPVVWEGTDGRYYALGGNGRTIAILLASDKRYQEYLRLGRSMYECFPQRSPQLGTRWVLVRIVSGLTEQQASQLGAASQLSSSIEEGRIGRALGLVRSLNLKIGDLPSIDWTKPISAANVQEFAQKNRAFVAAVTRQIDPAKRTALFQDDDRMAPVMVAVMLGFLPEELRRPGLLKDPKVEDALLGSLPAMISIQGMIAKKEIYPQYSLLDRLPEAFQIFSALQKRGLSFKALNAELAAERRTERIPGSYRMSDADDLSLALAAALYNAARRTAPEDVAAAFFRNYLERINRYKPRQRDFDSSFRPPDGGQLLADEIPGFELPNKAQAALFNPRRRRAASGEQILALNFMSSHFPSASETRSWAKAHGFHAGVPRATADGYRIYQQAGRWGGGVRLVQLAPGVYGEVNV